MSPLLLFLAWFVILLGYGTAMAYEEYKTHRPQPEANRQMAVALVYSIVAVSMAYCAGLWAPH